MSRRALGRGLEALLAEATADGGQSVTEIALSEIRPNPFQPRRYWDEESLKELAASIAEHGVLQPILVRRAGNGYELVAGERRFRACELAGKSVVPAIVVSLSDEAALEVALVENLQREDLGPLEEARAYQVLLEQFGYTQEQVAARVGKSRAQVANMVRLLMLNAEVQRLIEERALSVAHGKVLAGVADVAEQRRLANACVSQRLSVRDLEELVRGRKVRTAAGERPVRPYADVEGVLRERFGTKVVITGKKGRGVIRIEYYDKEDLDRILGIIGVLEG